MGITFGGQPVLDPKTLIRFCAERNLPTERWLGKVNGFENVLGTRSGQGWILLSAAVLNAINVNALADLVMESPTGDTVTHKNLMIVSAECALPGFKDDTVAPFVVELADRRRTAYAVPIDQGYNCRVSNADTTYLSGTLNSGVPWTWDEVIEDLWTTNGKLDDYPGLPDFSADTVNLGSSTVTLDAAIPDGLAFYGGMSSMDALGIALDRLNCTLQWNSETDTFDIVRIGATDSGLDDAIDSVDGVRLWDRDNYFLARANVPEMVQVMFPVVDPGSLAGADGSSPWYSVLKPDPSGTLPGVEAGTVVTLIDDLSAVYDGTHAAPRNALALNSKATIRAVDFFRRARQKLLYRVYRSIQGLQPGSQLDTVKWLDRGLGYTTAAERNQESAGGIGGSLSASEGASGGYSGYNGTLPDGTIVFSGRVMNPGGGPVEYLASATGVANTDTFGAASAPLQGAAYGMYPGSVFSTLQGDGTRPIAINPAWLETPNGYKEILGTSYYLPVIPTELSLGTDSAGHVRQGNDTLHPIIGSTTPVFTIVHTGPELVCARDASTPTVSGFFSGTASDVGTATVRSGIWFKPLNSSDTCTFTRKYKGWPTGATLGNSSPCFVVVGDMTALPGGNCEWITDDSLGGAAFQIDVGPCAYPYGATFAALSGGRQIYFLPPPSDATSGALISPFLTGIFSGGGTDSFAAIMGGSLSISRNLWLSGNLYTNGVENYLGGNSTIGGNCTIASTGDINAIGYIDAAVGIKYHASTGGSPPLYMGDALDAIWSALNTLGQPPW